MREETKDLLFFLVWAGACIVAELAITILLIKWIMQ